MGSDHDDDDKPLERVHSANISARVPEAVSAGVFATGVIVLQSPTEVMVDFIQGVANPRRIAVRVVMPASVAVQFVEALGSNLAAYEQSFGEMPHEPQAMAAAAAAKDTPRKAAEAGAGEKKGERSAGDDAPSSRSADKPAGDSHTNQPPLADAYDLLKASDEVLGGAYANTVTIAHTGSEFHFDFINRCFPRSIVTARVYMAAPRAPALLDSLKRSLRLG